MQTGDHPSPTKLIERKAVCLEKLGRYDEAAAELQTVAAELGTDEKSSEKVSELEQKIRKLRSGEGSGEIRNGLIDPEQFVFNPNPLYPALSDSIKIEYTKERGRYGVAARDIEVKSYQIVS